MRAVLSHLQFKDVNGEGIRMRGFYVMLAGLGLMIAAMAFTSIQSVAWAWAVGVGGLIVCLVSAYMLLRERRRKK